MHKIASFEDFVNKKTIVENDEDLDLELDDLFTEAVRKSTAESIKDAEVRIKDQITRYSELLKKNPTKSPIYKAQIDLANAKWTVLQLRKKVLQLKK